MVFRKTSGWLNKINKTENKYPILTPTEYSFLLIPAIKPNNKIQNNRETPCVIYGTYCKGKKVEKYIVTEGMIA